MYKEIGAFDAKAKLSELLREVRGGQRYTITVRGEPVADLVPFGSATAGSSHAAVEAMRQLKKITGVDGHQVLEWIGEGRR
ncbi:MULTISPECIES: type II toxin-antitoxin system Phd/YefM family antitoxin [Duganella]|uniref:type II toxin-antitoxin system Phd/YefM family antitoxin n=1 Tax=Duganella TaxID=75654 RepID=UPI0030E74DC8